MGANPGERGELGVDGWAYPTVPESIVTSDYKTPQRPSHRGVDMALRSSDINAAMGKPIFAARDGDVVAAGPASGFGNWIIIQHTVNGRRVDTVYGHMYDDGVLVKVGQKVTAGQQIGKIGSNGQSTGAHLHFEVWEGGRLPEGAGQETNPNPVLEAGKGNAGSQPADDPRRRV
ncbi:MAG: M23 family metallopeptidase [Chloroflexi bacterium]|nr:MAG: M23 family metallopeptidase [Chloroflexota bacterium]